METRCEKCGRDCWIEDDRAGEQIVCPWCDKIFVAVEPPERLLAFASIVESLLSETEAKAEPSHASGSPPRETDRPAPRRKTQKRASSRRWQRMAALSIITAIVAGGVVAAGRWLASLEWSASAQAVPSFVPWEPDPLLVDQLGGWKKFDQFKFRPPKSFSQINVLSDPGWLPPRGHFAGLEFEGEKRNRAAIYCSVVTFPPMVPIRGGLEDALARFYDWLNFHAALVDLKRGQPEVGLLGGRTCIRASFYCRLRRRNSLRGDAREGVVYVMLDNNRQVTFYTLCDPTLQDEHDLMGASLLTWREQ